MKSKKKPSGSTLSADALPANTIDILAYHAVTRGGQIAVFENGTRYRYDQLYLDICKTVTYLRSVEFGPEPKAAVAVGSLYLHMVLTLGLEAVGVCTMSYATHEIDSVEAALQDFDLVLCSADNAPTQSKKTVILDPEWLAMLEGLTPEMPLVQSRFAPDDPFRIIKTSGTTGSLKMLTLPWGKQHRRFQQFQFLAGMTEASRYVVARGFSIQAYHTHCTACLRAGGTCIGDSRYTIAESLKSHEATHVTMIPHALTEILENLPDGYQKPANLRIFTIGAQVSTTIRQKIEARLASSLIESYATNEAAYICTMQADSLGVILPGVMVEVLNEEGESVQQQPGVIRLRSEVLLDGYRDDPDTTARMFKDGWFYPGDLGILGQNGILKLIGRADDQLNIRGIKIPPQPIEEAILSEFNFQDAALCLVPDSEGAEKVWLAVVTKGDTALTEEERDAITEKMPSLLPSTFGTTQMVFLDQIPRTATGKIQRDVLKTALQEIIQKR